MADQTKSKATETDQNIKTMAALAYIIFFIPMLTNKDSKFAMYHANQGLVLLLTWMALWFVSMVLGAIMLFVGGLFLMPLVGLAGIVLAVMGILNALNGEMKPLPVIGGITLLK